MKNVTIYTSSSCSYCHAAKDYFNENNIPPSLVIESANKKTYGRIHRLNMPICPILED